MTKEITSIEINQIWMRWERYDIPTNAANEAWKYAEKTNNRIADMVFNLEFDKDMAYALGKKQGGVVSRSF